jgi:hypothetical protein
MTTIFLFINPNSTFLEKPAVCVRDGGKALELFFAPLSGAKKATADSPAQTEASGKRPNK